MSLNMQTSSRTFWAVARTPRQTGCLTRPVHVRPLAQTSLIQPQRPSISRSQPFSSTKAQNLQDTFAHQPRKERRRRPFPHQEDEDAGSPTSKPQKTSIQGQHAYEDNGMIVTLSNKNFRDKEGRPWDTRREEISSTSVGVDVGMGMDVGAGAGGKRKGKKRNLELRDLAVRPSPKKPEPWQVQKEALKNKFGEEGWNPRKRLSPDALEGIKALHVQDPERWSSRVLAEHFKVSPEAIRRILKSKWRPSPEEMEERRERWAKRHDRIWDQQAELGLRPPRTVEKTAEDPDAFEEELKAREVLDNARNA